MTAPLTGREREVLQLLADGHTQAAIGRRLDICDRTVRRVAGALFAKLGAVTAAQAVANAARAGILDAGPDNEVVQQWRAAGYQLALVPIRR